MLSTQTMTVIYEAAEEYRRGEGRRSAVSRILRILPGLSAQGYSYLCRCLDTYPWSHETATLVTEEFPRHIPAMSTDFLCEMLEFPWLSETDKISPAQVVLGIARNRGLSGADGDGSRLQRALRDYIKRRPETAFKEFFRIHEISSETSEALWHELSSHIRDEVAFMYRRPAERWRLDELMEDSYWREVDAAPLSASELVLMRRALDVIRRHTAKAGPTFIPGQLLLAAALSEDRDETLTFPQAWVKAHFPPFMLPALEGLKAGTKLPPIREGRAEELPSPVPPRRRAALSELAEKLRHLERFSPRRHAPLLERLTPAEFVYLCGALALSDFSRWGSVAREVSAQYALCVRGLNRTYLLKMLETPWQWVVSDFGVLKIIYEISLSTGLLTAPYASWFARAFAAFLNDHPEWAAREFLDLKRECSLTFAEEIWSQLGAGVREGALAIVRLQLTNHFGFKIYPKARDLRSLGWNLKKSIESIAQSDEQPLEVRTVAAALQIALSDALETSQLNEDWLLGFASLLATRVEGEEARDETKRRAPKQVPEFVARHAISPSFAFSSLSALLVRLLRDSLPHGSASSLSSNPVYVGVSAPIGATPGSDFIARLYAYAEEFQGQVEDVINSLAPTSKRVSGLRRCRWRVGETVTVRASGTHVTCKQPVVHFEWNGAYEIADFHFVADKKAADKVAIIAFALEVSGVTVATVQIEVQIRKEAPAGMRNVRTEAARTGFASYATEDRPEVLGRVSSIEQSAGMLIFVDCLDLHPSEEWRPMVEREIIARDIFLLFWSLRASNSDWVRWEWQTALKKKGTKQMEIHPLQAPHLAPPPKELAHLHFGDRYLAARGEPPFDAAAPNVVYKRRAVLAWIHSLWYRK